MPPPQRNAKRSKGIAQLQNEFSITTRELGDIFSWVDQIPLSRPKRNINRDFSDGVLFSEILAATFPKLVDLHNYVAASSLPQKKNNWETLNRKVLSKIGMKFADDLVLGLSQAKIGAIETALKKLYDKVNQLDTEMLKEKQIAESEIAAARGDGNDGDSNHSGNSPREDVCIADGNPNSGVIYKGVKMVPIYLVEQKDTKIDELENKLRELKKKVRRQETLISLKEDHLQELTFSLHACRLQKEEEAKEFQDKLNKWTDPTGLV